MALKKNVMLDGKIYSYHVVQEATVNWNNGFINIMVLSWVDETSFSNEDDPFISSVNSDLVEGLNLQMAYAIVDAQWQEYTDERDTLIEELADILTDEQAETVPQAFPEWKTDISYTVGKRVCYNSKLYRCVQAHTSQEGWEPPTTPALWVRTAPDGEIPDWVQPTGAQDAYNTGDKVKHNTKTWESTIDGNVWEPGVYGWAEVTE